MPESFDVKSYVKIYGPPLVKAIRALEKIAAESPIRGRLHWRL